MTKTKTLHAVFDGKVLIPEERVDLEVGTRYVLSIESTQKINDIKRTLHSIYLR